LQLPSSEQDAPSSCCSFRDVQSAHLRCLQALELCLPVGSRELKQETQSRIF
jgi:hypothetical protein